MSSKIWMVRSDCPPVYGWKVVLNFNEVPSVVWRLTQNREVNLGSLSLTIDTGTPWSLMISTTYNLAYLSVEYVTLTGRKCADLVNQSIITQIESKPRVHLGNPTTKSMVMCSHFYTEIGRLCNKPVGLWCSILTYWQVKHLATNSAISFFIPFHQKFSRRVLYIF